MANPVYKRVLLKLSGESLAGQHKFGLDHDILTNLAEELKEVSDYGVQLGIVVGGGNIYRGLQGAGNGMDRVPADHMGMMATVINAIAMQHYLEKTGLQTRVMSAIAVDEVAEPYIRRRAIRHLEKGRAVIFAAGTGNPFFTTDTAAALRAGEVGAEVFLKGTRVEGIYDKDPESNRDAVFIKNISYNEALKKNLRVMDLTAFTFCQDNNIPIRIFNMNQKGNLLRLLSGDEIGSEIT